MSVSAESAVVAVGVRGGATNRPKRQSLWLALRTVLFSPLRASGIRRMTGTEGLFLLSVAPQRGAWDGMGGAVERKGGTAQRASARSGRLISSRRRRVHRNENGARP